MLKEFKEFAVKGNAIDLAVGVVVGAAFTTIVNSLVGDIINPIIGVFTGKVDLSRFTVGLPGDSVLALGSFLNAIINFLIVSFAIFLLVKQINRFRRSSKTVPSEKECDYCKSKISIRATKCPNCTSELS